MAAAYRHMQQYLCNLVPEPHLNIFFHSPPSRDGKENCFMKLEIQSRFSTFRD